MELLRRSGGDVCDLGHRVFVLSIWLTAFEIFEPGEQRSSVTVELAFQVVAPQKLHRAFGRFRSAGREQIQSAGERVPRRIADFYPLRVSGAAVRREDRNAEQ